MTPDVPRDVPRDVGLHVDVRVADRDVEVAFEVDTGQTVALIGPNGAGKSTTLAVLAGLLRPDAGEVRLEGRLLTGDRTWVAPHARRTALLAQEPLLFPHLRARDNVAFGPRSTGASRAEARAVAERWLSEVDALALADRRPAQLSGGQAQRVAVARALAADPRLLLLDEPMAALDVDAAPALRRLLGRVLAERTTVLVTHHVLDALLLADRVVVLEAGRVVEQGPTADVLARPRSRFAAQLAGLNLVAGTATPDGVRRPDGLALHGTAAGDPPAAGAPAVAVFRPAAVAVHARPPGGSPRNALTVRVEALEPQGDHVRVRAGGLAADVTLAAVAELGLAVGAEVTFVVKANEVAVHAR
ncbi:ABC transporter ATP-binding protein [Nocardioides sp. zg-536]|uniref:ABC transporter ATP-binding protein n=2 Tax=Nocardioides faecalis TaxID=2803858 RepID=A0A938Y5U1_9ACTN|nr:ABC transporter ATP-binding protein [Nocardioides faecalis]QVI60705.1 ABC transporter ATP-binding protein [Nocardioides faecalis]